MLPSMYKGMYVPLSTDGSKFGEKKQVKMAMEKGKSNLELHD